MIITKDGSLATVLVPDRGSYGYDAFCEGLKRHGFTITHTPTPQPGNVLVVWNRRRHEERYCHAYEAVGAKVIVTENGWIGTDHDGQRLYALCLSHHNGAGRWHVGSDDRWSKLDIPIKPWRASGNHILILAQRGFGELGVAQPAGWVESTQRRLSVLTERPVRVRPHPGGVLTERPALEPDLANCWAAVTWASGAGIKAIVAGVPVIHDMPGWIGAPAARRGIEHIEQPFLGDRIPMLNRLAWAQWSAEELATGEPFAGLLAIQ